MIELPFHPLAEIFPLMTDAELKGLTADIEEHGQLEVIVTLDGAILDGRNRYRACQDIGIEPKVVEWSGVGSAQAFVVSHNLHRRHLNESQRALIGARIATSSKNETHANLKQGNTPGVGITTPGGKEVAALLNIHRATLSEAKTVLRDGTKEEIEAIESGAAAVSTIARRIRNNVPPEKRLLREPEGALQRRTDTLRVNAQLWGLFRDAIKNLTALPHPDDMIRIIKGNDKAHLTEAKLSIALNYLTAFEAAWNNRSPSNARNGNSGK